MVNDAVDHSFEFDVSAPLEMGRPTSTVGDRFFVVWRGRWEITTKESTHWRTRISAGEGIRISDAFNYYEDGWFYDAFEIESNYVDVAGRRLQIATESYNGRVKRTFDVKSSLRFYYLDGNSGLTIGSTNADGAYYLSWPGMKAKNAGNLLGTFKTLTVGTGITATLGADQTLTLSALSVSQVQELVNAALNAHILVYHKETE